MLFKFETKNSTPAKVSSFAAHVTTTARGGVEPRAATSGGGGGVGGAWWWSRRSLEGGDAGTHCSADRRHSGAKCLVPLKHTPTVPVVVVVVPN